jgi:pimeloyl-ACP methyl ester carboxylesterase
MNPRHPTGRRVLLLVAFGIAFGASLAFGAEEREGTAEPEPPVVAAPPPVDAPGVAVPVAVQDSARVAREGAFAFVDSLVLDRGLPPELKILLLERLLASHPGLRESWTYRAADRLGRLYMDTGNIEDAVSFLELAVEGRGDDADLLNTLGYLYAEENIRIERAEELVRRALAAAPPTIEPRVLGYYHDSLGWVLHRRGQDSTAGVELELANRMAPGTPEIRSHLVDVYEALGRVEDGSRILAEDLVASRGLDPELRTRLRQLHHTTPEGKPLPIEAEVEQKVLALEVAELDRVEAVGGTILRLEARDGFPLVASYFPAGSGKGKSKGSAKRRAKEEASSPAVVLLPMFGGSRADYEPLAHELARSGITALALDPRGHGASVTEELWSTAQYQDDLPSFLQGALLDLEAALAYLRGSPASGSEAPKGDERSEEGDGEEEGRPLAVIGASLGGMVGALGVTDEEEVKALVLLSPGPADPFVEAVASAPHRPTLLVAAAQDRTANAGAEAMLAHLDASRSKLVVYPGSAHGTELLAGAEAQGGAKAAGGAKGAKGQAGAEPLVPLVVRWLGAAFKEARGL